MMLPSRSKSAGAPETQELRKCPSAGADPARGEEVQALRLGRGAGRARKEAGVTYDVGKAFGAPSAREHRQGA